MPDKKLTDSEIVKALEKWRKELIADYQRLKLLDAPMDCFEESHADTVTKLSNALDLINRQKAEIENLKQIAEHQQSITVDRGFEIKRLKEENERLNFLLNDAYENNRGLVGLLETTKPEAYEEFANELKCRTHEISCNTLQVVTEYDIDNLLKELAGEGNGG